MRRRHAGAGREHVERHHVVVDGALRHDRAPPRTGAGDEVLQPPRSRDHVGIVGIVVAARRGDVNRRAPVIRVPGRLVVVGREHRPVGVELAVERSRRRDTQRAHVAGQGDDGAAPIQVRRGVPRGRDDERASLLDGLQEVAARIPIKYDPDTLATA